MQAKTLLKRMLPAPVLDAFRRRRRAYRMNHGQVAYSMEGEDLLLNRVFDDKRSGFYVDIGAFHPVFASNTYFFYKQGWRGINIEPTPDTAVHFRRKRPRDVTLELAVGARDEELDFFMFDDGDLNTINPRMKTKCEREWARLEVKWTPE